jgi:sarcosine oxidase subunit gamma
MSEAADRRHGLEAFLRDAPGDEDPGVEIRVGGDAGFINLRGNTDDERFVDAVGRVLGAPPPVTPNSFAGSELRTYWLGPDEWLVATPADRVNEICRQLEDAIDGSSGAVNDVSGGLVALQLRGTAARDVLAAGCTLDLHPGVFRPGACAQTGLARASILLALLDESPHFEIVVRRSFADYLARWLAHASRRARRVFRPD